MTMRQDEVVSVEDVLTDSSSRMDRAIEFMDRELSTLRTGRATPSLVENISVDYYGTPTPLSQLATISAPEARLITIQPWDRQSLSSIEKGILKSDMGFNPTNDGTIIRIQVTQLTQDRRRDMVRLLKRKVEDAKVAVRNVRRDSLETLRGMERSKNLSQDENRKAQEQLQKVTDSHVSQMDQVGSAKEAEIMQV